MADQREIAFYLRHGFNDVRRERALVVRLSVGEDVAWDMLPNRLARHSIISPQALDDLRTRGGVTGSSGRRITLRGLRIASQSVPDLEVRVSAAMTRLEVDGILGLNFFEQFDVVQWHPRTHRVALVFP